MDDYKHENNFRRVLAQLTLSDVKDAIGRVKIIMQRNEENGYVLQEYKWYRYYRENPNKNTPVVQLQIDDTAAIVKVTKALELAYLPIGIDFNRRNAGFMGVE
jgi:hypothetical protein